MPPPPLPPSLFHAQFPPPPAPPLGFKRRRRRREIRTNRAREEGEEAAHTATLLTPTPQPQQATRTPPRSLAAAAWKKCKHGASELTRSVLCLASGQSRRLDDRERRRRWRREEKGGRIAESEGTAHFPPAGLAISETKALHSPAHLPSRPSPSLSSPRSIH